MILGQRVSTFTITPFFLPTDDFFLSRSGNSFRVKGSTFASTQDLKNLSATMDLKSQSFFLKTNGQTLSSYAYNNIPLLSSAIDYNYSTLVKYITSNLTNYSTSSYVNTTFETRSSAAKYVINPVSTGSTAVSGDLLIWNGTGWGVGTGLPSLSAEYNNLKAKINSLSYDIAPIGSVVPYGGDTAPVGFLFCNGQVASKSAYIELFNVIGSKFNTGGETVDQFRLPNLKEAIKTNLGTLVASSYTKFTAKDIQSKMVSYGNQLGLPMYNVSRPSEALQAQFFVTKVVQGLTALKATNPATIAATYFPSTGSGNSLLYTPAYNGSVTFVYTGGGPTINFTDHFGLTATYPANTPFTVPFMNGNVAQTMTAFDPYYNKNYTIQAKVGTASVAPLITITPSEGFFNINYIIKFSELIVNNAVPTNAYIPKPASANTGQFLTWTGSDWGASSLSSIEQLKPLPSGSTGLNILTRRPTDSEWVARPAYSSSSITLPTNTTYTSTTNVSSVALSGINELNERFSLVFNEVGIPTTGSSADSISNNILLILSPGVTSTRTSPASPTNLDLLVYNNYCKLIDPAGGITTSTSINPVTTPNKNIELFGRFKTRKEGVPINANPALAANLEYRTKLNLIMNFEKVPSVYGDSNTYYSYVYNYSGMLGSTSIIGGGTINIRSSMYIRSIVLATNAFSGGTVTLKW